MHYSALIQNRKSVREFTDKQVFFGDLDEIREYYNRQARRLIPEIQTELKFFGTDSREALEGAAGYLMEDLVLKLLDMGLDSCWVTFTDSEKIKSALDIRSEREVAAIVAFGYGKKTTKRLRLNIHSMSNVDVVAQHWYMEPKRSLWDMAYLNTWGNGRNLDSYIGFFDDMLWESLYAASLAPSYLNRQAYGFLLHDGNVTLVSRPDGYNTQLDGELSLGIVLLHFSAVAENWAGKLAWRFGPDAAEVALPEGHQVVASCRL